MSIKKEKKRKSKINIESKDADKNDTLVIQENSYSQSLLEGSIDDEISKSESPKKHKKKRKHTDNDTINESKDVHEDDTQLNQEDINDQTVLEGSIKDEISKNDSPKKHKKKRKITDPTDNDTLNGINNSKKVKVDLVNEVNGVEDSENSDENEEKHEKSTETKPRSNFSIENFKKKLHSSDGIEAVKEFVEQCGANTSQDLALDYINSGGNIVEILHLLDTQDKKNLSLATPVFEAVNILLLKIQSNAIQNAQNAIEGCRYLLNNYLITIHSGLSPFSTLKQKRVTLKLLTSIVTLSPLLAKEILLQLNFTEQILENLTQQNDGSSLNSVRTAFIHFLLSFLIEGNSSNIRNLLEKKGVVGSIFEELIYDDYQLVNLVLTTLQRNVLESSSITKTSKLYTFSSPVLKNIVNLYNWKGRKYWKAKIRKKSNSTENFIDENEKNIVIEVVHNFLIVLCTSRKYGIVFHDKTYGTSGKRFNNLIYTMLECLERPWEHKYVSELVIKIACACPDLYSFIIGSVDNYLEPRASIKWLNVIMFVKGVITSIKNNILIEDLKDLNSKQLIQLTQNLFTPNVILKVFSQTKIISHGDPYIREINIDFLNSDSVHVLKKILIQTGIFENNQHEINYWLEFCENYNAGNLLGTSINFESATEIDDIFDVIQYSSNTNIQTVKHIIVTPLILAVFDLIEKNDEYTFTKSDWKYLSFNIKDFEQIQTIYDEYEYLILKTIEKPHKAGVFTRENSNSLIKLIVECMPIEKAEQIALKVNKYEIVEEFHLDLLEKIYIKYPEDEGNQDEGKLQTIETIYEMIQMHSEFLDVMLDTKNYKLKIELLKLIIILIKYNKKIINTQLIPILLGAYNCTINESDQLILAILYLFEQNSINFDKYKPFLWGELAITHYSVRHNIETAIWRQPRMQNVLELIQMDVVYNTIMNFDWKRSFGALDDGDIVKINDINLYEDRYVENKHRKRLHRLRHLGVGEDFEKNVQIYDLNFFLPLFSQLLSSESFVKCYLFTQHGCLALTLLSLASKCPLVRQAGYNVLARFYFHLESSINSRNSKLWIEFINRVRCGLVKLQEKTKQKDTDTYRIPVICAVFLARSAIIMNQPLNPLYMAINNFIFVKSVIDFTIIPEFLQMFHSPEIEYNIHRNWILQVIRDGFKTNLDFQIMRKSMAYKMILDFYSCTFATDETKLLILQILEKSTQISYVTKYLLFEIGILSWMNNILHNFHKTDTEQIHLILKIINNIYLLINEFENSNMLQEQLLYMLITISTSLLTSKISIDGFLLFMIQCRHENVENETNIT
ncbi:nucleolar pre-ribosomal-associated protein 1 [Chrysoperla carnea]|uniref:nucleolar pre-ribosomal-associated protein 1 n=1 Tax=Chrysoperla carnea TaxID=189513 RepID=UPI001D08218C|nr:nucleolar pre-ribosomal-associated protein 1 [Chrysoperla carnea]